MLGPWWDVGVIMWYSFVVLMYLWYGFSCEWAIELFVVSQSTPLSVVVADCFLVPVIRMFVVVKIDQYRIGSFVLIYSCFEALNSSVSWCFAKDLVWLDGYAPRPIGAFGGTTSRLEIRKLSLMSPPRNVQ